MMIANRMGLLCLLIVLIANEPMGCRGVAAANDGYRQRNDIAGAARTRAIAVLRRL